MRDTASSVFLGGTAPRLAPGMPPGPEPPAAPWRRWTAPGRLLPALALLLAALAAAWTALRWIHGHPEIAGWDELAYADEVLQDLIARVQGGWGALRDNIFLETRWKPPGTRLLGVPMLLAGAADATSLRLLSLAAMGVAAALAGLAAAAVSGAGAGLLAAAAMLGAPATVRAGEEFMTETLALPALAGVLWCLAREWARPEPPRGNALLLGLFVGIGLLARFSVAVQLAPALVLAAGLGLAFDRRRLARLGTAAFAALLIAWPFYALNGARFIGYARTAVGEWQGHRLLAAGPVEFLLRWAGRLLADYTLGPVLAAVLACGLVGLALLAVRGLRWRRPPPALIVAGFALALTAPVVAGHLVGQNQNFRFLAATVPGFAVAAAIGIAAGLPRVLPAAAALVGLQALLVAAGGLLPPVPGLAGLRDLHDRVNLSCDWRGLAERLPGKEPRLFLLGNNDGFSPVQLGYAFHRLGRRVQARDLRVVGDAADLQPFLAEADAVLVLVRGEPEYLQPGLYHAPARPPVVVLPAEPAALLPGFAESGEIAAPGDGACRARLFTRAGPPGAGAEPARPGER